jgi:hypothetical protein
MEKVVNAWAGQPKYDGSSAAKYDIYLNTLTSFIEKVTIYRKTINFVDQDLYNGDALSGFKLEKLYEKYTEFAKVIADQGLIDLAWVFLQNVPDVYVSSKPGLENLPSILKHKVSVNGGYLDANGQIPLLPFETVDVVDVSMVQSYNENTMNIYAYQGQYGQQPQQQQQQHVQQHHHQIPQQASYYQPQQQQQQMSFAQNGAPNAYPSVLQQPLNPYGTPNVPPMTLNRMFLMILINLRTKCPHIWCSSYKYDATTEPI